MTETADLERAFVADVAHDLQNPLTGMRTQLEFALSRSRTDAQEGWIRSMLTATTEMELLVSDLLALAAEERRDQPLPSETVDLDALVRDEVDRPRPDDRVVVDAHGVTQVSVRGDDTSLRRLVRNLLDNAVRHARSRVWLSLAAEDGRVVLQVVDDGQGVDEVHRERIFERFYRADRSQGTGLGLSIVRQVAQRHGGDVEMLPGAPGEGARFRVRLPMAD